MSEARKAADSPHQRGLITAAEQGHQQARSFVDKGRRTARSKHASKVIDHVGLLLDRVDKTLRASRLGGDAAERRQQGRYRGCYSGLRVVAIEPERTGNAIDQVRR